MALTFGDDATLACALIRKEKEAARVAWARFSPMVRRMLRRTLGPEQDVEDVVQDVFLCLFDRITTLRDPQALRGFVIALTMRIARYQIRRRRVRRFVTLSRTAELSDSRFRGAECDSQHALLKFYEILDRLKERDRSAFVLRFIEGLDAAEVAAALGVSIPTARRHFTYAWARVTFYAERDSFLSDYLLELGPCSSRTTATPEQSGPGQQQRRTSSGERRNGA